MPLPRSSARNDFHCGLLRFLDLVTSPAMREQFCACSLEENGAIPHQSGFWIPEKASSEPADGGDKKDGSLLLQGTLRFIFPRLDTGIQGKFIQTPFGSQRVPCRHHR